MDPYDILGIPSNATPDEIRKAYYTLVKQYHPDKNPSDEATERVRLINAAYEIVSDPIRRAQYQRPADVSIAYEEDPIEAYKREFKRKRWEKEQQAKARRLAREQTTYKIMRIVTFPIFFFAVVLVLDDFLPLHRFVETPITGWQERLSGGKYSKGELISRIQTENFIVRIPHKFHLAYPYYEENKPPIEIFVTPLFDIPRHIHCSLGRYYWRMKVPGTIHTQIFQVPWLLLIISSFVVARKKFSFWNYVMCFLPALLLAFVIVVMA
jgi:hypothetical protein